MENKQHVLQGLESYEEKIDRVNKRIKELSYFDYSMSLIQRIVERGERKDDPAWQEIERLLKVKEYYQQKIDELNWQITPSDLSKLEFYAFTAPKSALIAVKVGVKPLSVYSRCVTETYNKQVLFEKLTIAEVQTALKESVVEDTQAKVSEQVIQEELLDLGKYGRELFYQGSVLLIENKLI